MIKQIFKGKNLVLMAVTLAIVSLTGCGTKTTFDIKSSGKVAGATYYYLTEKEVAQTAAEKVRQSKDDPELAKEMDKLIKADGTEVVNNKLYYRYKTDLGEVSLSEINNDNKLSEENYLKMTTNSFEYLVPKDTPGLETTDTGISNEDIEFSLLEVKLPVTINKTNGKLSSDKKTVTWDLTKVNPGDKLYAYHNTSNTGNKKSKVSLSGVKNKGYLTKSKTIKVVTKENIKSITVNGKKIKGKSIKVTKEGKYNIVVKTNIGTTKFSFTYDKTKPTANIKAKTYTKPVKIKVKDKLSGVKSIKLNNKTVKNNYTVRDNGKYTLKITDKAGNSKVIKFKLDIIQIQVLEEIN